MTRTPNYAPGDEPPPGHVPGTPYDNARLRAKRGENPERGPKEVAYDTQIAPLMAQIIEIADAAKINFTAVFYLDRDEDELPLKCSSCITSDLTDKHSLSEMLEIRMVTK